ncbi:MAG: (d)CMP kinase [Sedimentisphaerales bacterium]|nr:(d)CMP kinase [Sedimentisphaerales bacterium]
MANLIVTIDGPAASGKSTVARLLADRLDAAFLDTGAMYRAVTLAAINAGIDMTSQTDLLEIIQNTDFDFSVCNDKTIVSINGCDVTDQLRKPEITENARYPAAAPKVRAKLVEMQRKIAEKYQTVVTEGRDQGTVAFPNANVKFFLTADPGERAKRRHTELQNAGTNQKIQKVRSDIEKRDKSDQNRRAGPLKPAENAIIVDTTALSIEQVVENLLEYVQNKCSKNT